jgi:hypothetical protein
MRRAMMGLRFSSRTFTTFLVAWTFLALVISGVFLYLSPPGRIAHWTNWTLLGLTKEGWQGVHVMMALVFLVAGLFHLLKFNWKVFFHYLKTKKVGPQYRGEMVLSLLLFALFIVGSIANLPPFSVLMTLEESIKQSWESPSHDFPAPHTELLPLDEVSRQLGLEPDTALRRLQAKGWTVGSPQESLQDIAARNRTSPQALYERLRGAVDSTNERSGKARSIGLSRLGNRSLSEVAQALGIPSSRAVAILKEAGVSTHPGERIRAIATRLGGRPHDVVALLNKKETGNLE